MRQFDYRKLPAELVSVDIMNLLCAIHESKGKQQLFLTAKPDVLSAMTEIAKIQSTTSSNRIEGIRTSDKRIKQIMAEKADLKSRAEEEIAGYRDVLNMVHLYHDTMDVTPGIIMQLHRDMYRHTPSSMGGHFKVGDNEIRGIAPDGSEYVRFRPTPAVATPDAMDRLCQALRDGLQADNVDPLLVILQFVFDFTCIHPFNDGNGRMSRLLVLLLLYKAGYAVGKYVSIEKEIERTKDSYYDALQASSDGWNEDRNDVSHFVRYMLGVILACYRDFEGRVSLVTQAKLSKAERVEAVIYDSIATISKSEIMDAVPDASAITVERTLHQLLQDGKIRKVGAGRSTSYSWVRL